MHNCRQPSCFCKLIAEGVHELDSLFSSQVRIPFLRALLIRHLYAAKFLLSKQSVLFLHNKVYVYVNAAAASEIDVLNDLAGAWDNVQLLWSGPLVLSFFGQRGTELPKPDYTIVEVFERTM